MKKTHLVFLCVLPLLVSRGLAQPTLTANGINPVVGDKFSTYYTQYVNPGNSGALQTWDLSTMDSSSFSTSEVVPPSSTPYASSFPQANIAGYDGSAYAYQKTSSNAWQNYGFASPTGIVMAYSDPEDFLRFPFTYNNTFTDSTWAVTFISGGETYYRTGSTTVTADGYGILITPNGTYNNVLRIHFFQTYQDSAFIGFPVIYSYQNDEYMWYSDGFHSTHAAVWSLTSSFGSSTAGAYSSNTTTGFNEKDASISYNIYPNPSPGYLNLNIHSNTNQKVEIWLFNTKGMLVEMPVNDWILQGSNEYNFNVAELPDGTYFTRVIFNGTIPSTQKFTIAK